VRATVGTGEIIIRNKQAELEARGQTEDLAALSRDPHNAYEITKDSGWSWLAIRLIPKRLCKSSINRGRGLLYVKYRRRLG